MTAVHEPGQSATGVGYGAPDFAAYPPPQSYAPPQVYTPESYPPPVQHAAPQYVPAPPQPHQPVPTYTAPVQDPYPIVTDNALAAGDLGQLMQPQRGGTLEARNISAWFGTNKVLERVSLNMPANTVTALIGPSGCGKSTFLRILNRMHELVGSAQLNGEVLLDGQDIYASGHRITTTRNRIGMVFQKPNPFPAMSIADNVTAGLKLTGTKIGRSAREELIETSLSRAGLWKEVKDRLKEPGSALSGGQQQRLCIARSLAVNPEVLLMDEPCSALDPTSTRRVEETIHEIKDQVTIVIVTHNMQQAARVSQQCAFFLAELGTPGQIVEAGDTEQIFNDPVDNRTFDYVNGRFG
jgi:phosphate transport system ATP-binding protein